MTAEEKVLADIQEKINILFTKIAELKVTEEERIAWEKEKEEYHIKIADYKRHKEALLKREARCPL